MNQGSGSNPAIGNIRVFELDPFVAGFSESVCRNTSTLILSKCLGSSERFKEQISDLADSSKLFQLRPITYFYKAQYDDGSRQLQHGLIAEEVAKLYPDLVEYEKDGQPYTVKYQMLAPLLLKELQKQHNVMAAQTAAIEKLKQQAETQQERVLAQQQEIDTLRGQLELQNAAFQERLSRLESVLSTQVAADKPSPAALAPNGGLQ